MSDALNRAERDALLARATELEAMLYPAEGGAVAPAGPARVRIMDTYYQVLAEYGDRLPRMPMSRCPFSGQIFKHSFDPFGLDGPWWQKAILVDIHEPAPLATFRVLLGAFTTHGREPAEAKAPVIPGPEVPFVVSRLLALAGMNAVISAIRLENGDTAYPIVYYSRPPHHPRTLHQPWLRQDLWYPSDGGGASWAIKNDPWDFDLKRWIDSGHLHWITEGNSDLKLCGRESGGPCPFLDLPGERYFQSIAGGKRELMEPPDGSPIDPFD